MTVGHGAWMRRAVTSSLLGVELGEDTEFLSCEV